MAMTPSAALIQHIADHYDFTAPKFAKMATKMAASMFWSDPESELAHDWRAVITATFQDDYYMIAERIRDLTSEIEGWQASSTVPRELVQSLMNQRQFLRQATEL